MRKCLLMVALLVLVFGVQACAEVSYQPVPVDASSGFTEVYDPNVGVEYGYARIGYWYWQDDLTNYWHYAYQIFNNDFYNTPTIQSDDYHFGWLVIGQPTTKPPVYDTINKFGINLDPDDTGFGPSDLVILDSSAGSSAGGGPWGHSLDPNNRGIDWTVSNGTNTPLPIAPAAGYWKKGVWTMTTAGQTSTSDANGQYFEMASTWAPALRMAAVVAYVDKEAAG